MQQRKFTCMKGSAVPSAIGRRHFLAFAGAAAAAWPSAVYPQNSARIRTIGFLMGLADDSEAKVRIAAFEEGLTQRGLIPGKDVKIEYRFSAGDPRRMQTYARELVALRPDLIVGHSTPVVRKLLQATHTIPVVFVVVADPVGSGFVSSIPHPGGNATGFTNLDATITGKLLTVLKQINPRLTHVGLMLNPDTGVSGGLFYLRPFEIAAPNFHVVAIPLPVRSPKEIEARFSELARSPDAGLVVMPDNFLTVHRQEIIARATELRIPAIYPYRYFAEAGGLISYGVDVADLFRRSADYASRILGGARPGDLPVQAPTKFELVINMGAAKSLGLEVPKILLAGADAVID